jgi:hypothetical protein
MGGTTRSFLGRLGRPFDLSSVGGLPLLQEVVLRSDPGSEVEKVSRTILEKAGYRQLRVTGLENVLGSSTDRFSLVWVGERGLRRREFGSLTAAIPIVVVLVAGAVLGGLDAYVAGSLLVAFYWMLGAAVVSAVFWFRYGRAYDSDLVFLSVSRPVSGGAVSSSTVSIILRAGRVVSHSWAERRVPIGVSGTFKLAAEVGALSREFRRRLSTSSTEVPSAPGPARSEQPAATPR